MSLSDNGGATTDITSFFRAPDLYACSCATIYGSVWPAIFGASGTFESPSRPWHAWHISAFARPSFRSPAPLGPAARREIGANKQSASLAFLRPVGITCLSLQMLGGSKHDGPGPGAIMPDQELTCRRTRCDRAPRRDRPRRAANRRATAPRRQGDPDNSRYRSSLLQTARTFLRRGRRP